MPNEGIKLAGRFVVLDAYTGDVLRRSDNIVVNDGLAWIKRRIIGGTVPACMQYIAVGSSGDAASAAQTALHAQHGIKQVSAGDTGSYQVTYSATYASGSGTGLWTECGVFDSNAGSMMCRTQFSDLTKGANDAFTVEYTIEVQDDGA
jgi:hypothetical protein